MSATLDTNDTTETAYQAIRGFRKDMESLPSNNGMKIEARYETRFFKTCLLTWAGCGCILFPLKNYVADIWTFALGLWITCLYCLLLWVNEKQELGKMLEHEYQTAKYTILHSQSPDAIPALLELMETEDNRAYVTQAMICLLPALDSQHVNVIGARQYHVLYDLVRHSYVLELRLAIVHAFGKIGNRETLRVLDTIAKEPDLPQQLMETIQQCRNTITEREQQTQSQQMLLRASENIRQPETLLRAAQPVPQTLSDNLLRANYSDMDVKQVQQQSRKER